MSKLITIELSDMEYANFEMLANKVKEPIDVLFKDCAIVGHGVYCNIFIRE